MKKSIALLVMLLATLVAVPAFAAPLRVYVADMNAVGVPNRDEMKQTVQALLASRLNGDRIIAVGEAGEADVLVTGTYIAIGKVFSVDALARTAAGRTLTRSFVQGEGQNELLPAIGKLAEKLATDLAALYPTGSSLPASALAAPPAVAAPPSDIIKSARPVRVVPKEGDFIKASDERQRTVGSGWLSRRLEGVVNLLAIGRTFADGSRGVLLAGERRVAYYRQKDDMKLLGDLEFDANEKILSLDTIDSGDGTFDLYVTIVKSGDLASRVFQVKDDKLVQMADDLPYYFRAFSLAGGPKKLYAQAMGRDADFFGDVCEVSRAGQKVTLKNPIKMPRYGTIYGFNQFKGRDGEPLTVTFTSDGYLAVYDQALKELWRSNDRFGGSELFFQREDLDNVRTTGERYRWIFMDQRIQVTSKGEVLVGKNDGFWVLGNARSYKKGAVYCMTWDGSSLEEQWRTKDTQNYMPDYLFDESRNELLLLQTVQRSGVGSRGASSLAIKKVE